MISRNKAVAILVSVFIVVGTLIFAEDDLPTSELSTQDVMIDGYNAYKNGDWVSAVLFFRKAMSNTTTNTPESWYMLINAEVNAADYKSASADCDYFFAHFANSSYSNAIQFQKGKVAYYLGDYEKSILVLSDYCHQNKESDMYPSALFWIAESFFASYNFDKAKPFYERIVSEFATCKRATDAANRIEAINQRSREEKLLYLLKETGEEYLSLKEGYEKDVKKSEVEKTVGTEQQVKKLKEQNTNLTEALDDEKRKNEALNMKLLELTNDAAKSQTPSMQDDVIINNDFEKAIKELQEEAAIANEWLKQQNKGE